MDYRHADNPTPFSSKMRAEMERGRGAKVLGVVRFKENPRALAVIFEQVPSDDDLRRIHDLLRSNAKVTGSPALSASPCGLPCYAGDNNGERK